MDRCGDDARECPIVGSLQSTARAPPRVARTEQPKISMLELPEHPDYLYNLLHLTGNLLSVYSALRKLNNE